VRVANMSAFADQPNYLFAWLREHLTESGAACPTQFSALDLRRLYQRPR
jgi:hypothetical protein